MQRTDLDGLVAFLKVAERRSFSAAARDLGVTPSAVSQAVRALERRAGVALLARTTRDVAPTEAGRRFLERARPAVEDIRAAFREAASLGGRPCGLLRLNVPRVALTSLIEPVLASFCEAYPEVQVEIYVDDRFANIVEDGFDAGIRLGEFVEADMVAVRLTPPFRLAVVGAPAYLARRGRPEHPSDLKRHACINFRQGARGGLYHWEFEEAGRDFAVAVDGPVIVNEAGTMMAAAVMGLGLAYTLAPVAEPLREQGLVETVLEDFCPETPGFFLYFPARHQVMPKLRAFIDHATRAPGGRAPSPAQGEAAQRPGSSPWPISASP
jgi:DNA-binding transcriptional LysR family regulator